MKRHVTCFLRTAFIVTTRRPAGSGHGSVAYDHVGRLTLLRYSVHNCIFGSTFLCVIFPSSAPHQNSRIMGKSRKISYTFIKKSHEEHHGLLRPIARRKKQATHSTDAPMTIISQLKSSRAPAAANAHTLKGMFDPCSSGWCDHLRVEVSLAEGAEACWYGLVFLDALTYCILRKL